MRKLVILCEEGLGWEFPVEKSHRFFKTAMAAGEADTTALLKRERKSLSAIALCVGAVNAVAALRRIRSNIAFALVPVIVISTDQSAELAALRFGANDFISARAAPEIMIRRISNQISLRETMMAAHEMNSARLSAEQLIMIMDSIPCGVLALRDIDGLPRVMFSNNRYFEILGYTCESYFNKYTADHIPVLDEDRARITREISEARAGERMILEYRSSKADGAIIWLRHYLTATSLAGMTGDIKLGVLYDITEEKRAREANEAKSAFLSRVSHDMRTPMNAMLGLTYLARMEQNSPEVTAYLENIATSGNYLLGLINDVLDLAKIESGKMELREAPYGVSEFMAFIDSVIRPLMANKRIKFKCAMKCGLINIVVDKLRFNQIFLNLLSNAVKFTPVDGTIEFTAEPLSPKGGKHGMRYHIIDNGIGMSEEFLDVIFEPFSQENHDPEAHTGSGLGLAIVKQIVAAMGGEIAVLSAPGKGTEFIVDLYTVEASNEELRARGALGEHQLSGLRALLVEDNEMNVLVAQKLLERKGCEVAVARNGRDGAAMFAASAPGEFDFILMDVRMPVMNGYDATIMIRALDRHDAEDVPIIAMTAEALLAGRVRASEVGMDAHIAKPIDPELFYETINQCVRARRANSLSELQA